MTPAVARELPYGDRGDTVEVSRNLNCPTHLLPGGKNEWMLRYALEDVTTDDIFHKGIARIVDLPFKIPLTVIENPKTHYASCWAIYRGHGWDFAKHSPFIDTRVAWPLTSHLTLHFFRGKLSQVTPGDDVVPPVPWMPWAKDYKYGGYNACLQFWLTHSLLYSRNNHEPWSKTTKAPSWWQNTLALTSA